MQISLQPSNRTKVRKTKMFIEGFLTIQYAGQFLEKTKDTLCNYDIIDIVVKNVQDIDLTFIQLIVSMKKVKEEKKIKIIYELSSEHNNLLKNCGFENLFI
ncbi:MAG: hypothetical protein A3F72_14460 [Bacteroidetes bacterium RIFCSPLOWO2_12_FULL_35_15]|nr:MAG: hypothetical protein A3F72_14460 [Bacteroidetes bacterium RIFCSPLOWO2_12_FULL_35_15]